MFKSRRIFTFAVLCLLAVFTTTCALPAPVARLFATETPTSTPTLTATATPNTTPLPPLTIEPCPYTSLCPDAEIIRDFIQGNLETGKVNNVDVPYDKPISFYINWVAQDSTILAQNLEFMQFYVMIDGQNYWNESFKSVPEPYIFSNEPGKEYAAQWVGVVLSGWEIGQPHEIRIGYTFTEQINDGWDTYASGTVIEDIFAVNPVLPSMVISNPTLSAQTQVLEPTATLVSPTPTAATVSNQGGAIIGSGTTELVLYGQRTGAIAEGIQVVNAKTLDEVKTQSGVQMALSGSGPQLFAYFPNQPFKFTGGETALADVSVGSTEDPNISIGFLWTSEIDGTFPAAKVTSAQMEAFIVQSGQSADMEGWLQFGKVWLADTSATPGKPQENLDFFLFHHGEDIYVLGFLPNYQSVLPAEDLKGSAPAARSGEGQTYLVKGFLGGTVSIPLGGMFPVPLPILQVTSIERKN
jgi:hypothetical protein